VGVLCGLPFGNYIYTDHLGHRLAGVLPWVIPLCWLILILTAHALCGALLTRAPDLEVSESPLLLNITTATVVTLVDLILEPVAAHVRHYWIWLDRDPLWYGVPRVNFIGWFATAFLLSMFLSRFLDPQRYRISTAWMSLGILGSIQLLFALVNWRAGFYATAFIALNLTGGLAFLLVAAGGRNSSGRGDAAL
jgi:putative membrane protein